MPKIPYTIRHSVFNYRGRRKCWYYKYERIFVNANDATAEYLAKNKNPEKRYQWKIEKQKQKARITEISLDEVGRTDDGDEYYVQDSIEDTYHPENRNPLTILVEKEFTDGLNHLYSLTMPPKQVDVFKLHEQGYTISDIVEMFGIDESSARERLHNAFKKVVELYIMHTNYDILKEAVSEEEDLRLRAVAIARGGKKRGPVAKEEPKTKEVRQSITDPDSGYLNRPGKPQGFHYLSHQSSDAKSGIITDVYVTSGNEQDCVPYVNRILHQIEKYDFKIKEVGLDMGYDHIEIHKGMHDLGIKTYIPIKPSTSANSGVFFAKDFRYDAAKDTFFCPNEKELRYASVSQTKHAKIYSACSQDCVICPLRPQCLGGKQKRRLLRVPFFQDVADKQRLNSETGRYYEVQRLRQIFCEGNFATQKEYHNLRRTRKRGNKNVTEHCLLSALALNLKRLVKYLKRRPIQTLFYRMFFRFFDQKTAI